jgi:Tol biopolymer transport system component
MKDDQGVVQVYEVSVHGGATEQISHLPASVQAQFNLSPDATSIAVIADNSLWLIDVKTGDSRRLTEKTSDEDAPVLAVNWNNQGNTLVYNRYVAGNQGRYLQIFKLMLN